MMMIFCLMLFPILILLMLSGSYQMLPILLTGCFFSMAIGTPMQPTEYTKKCMVFGYLFSGFQLALYIILFFAATTPIQNAVEEKCRFN